MTAKNATFAQIKAVIVALMGQANTITIPRELVRFFDGDYVAAGMMSQLIYWDDKGDDPDGWIYKTAEQWDEELCLSEYQIRRGAKVLADRGFAAREFRKNKRYRNGSTPVWHYLADMDTFITEFTRFLQGQVSRPSRNSTPEVQQTATSVIEETATSSIDTQPTTTQPTTTILRGDGAHAPGGGGTQGDCSWKTETYRYLMQIHHQYPHVFTQPNSKNAKKYAELPLAVVKQFTEECVTRGLRTGMLLRKCQDYLDNPPPPPSEAAPASIRIDPTATDAPTERPAWYPLEDWGKIRDEIERQFYAECEWDGQELIIPIHVRPFLTRFGARVTALQQRLAGGAA